MGKIRPTFKTIIIVLIFITFSCVGESNKMKSMQAQAPALKEIKEQTKPVINVYIENSYSMDGYVNSDTEFKDAIFNYLGKIKMSGISDTLNLFYINRNVYPQGSVVQHSNSTEMENFIKNLNPTNFKQKGGTHEDRQQSDIAKIIESVLSETKDNRISILVSDGIFSPGQKEVSKSLSIQQDEIAIVVNNILRKQPKIAVIIYQLSSMFKSDTQKKIYFYNKNNDRINYTGQIPYYIYVFGNAEYLSELRNKITDSDFIGGGVTNVFSIVSGNQQVKYAINQSIGIFDRDKQDPNKTINNLKKDNHTGKVKFAINVDFSNLLLDDSYLLNPDNYENSSKYTLEIKHSSTTKYTHVLYFTSDRVYVGTIMVKLKALLPDWIETANDEMGTTAVKDKTYGIKYQLGGVFDAFTFTNKFYTEIKVNIK